VVPSLVLPGWEAQFNLYSSNSEGSKKLPDEGRLPPKRVGASVWNKGVVKSVHVVGHFY
jgi:hypothetical protein